MSCGNDSEILNEAGYNQAESSFIAFELARLGEALGTSVNAGSAAQFALGGATKSLLGAAVRNAITGVEQIGGRLQELLGDNYQEPTLFHTALATHFNEVMAGENINFQISAEIVANPVALVAALELATLDLIQASTLAVSEGEDFVDLDGNGIADANDFLDNHLDAITDLLSDPSLVSGAFDLLDYMTGNLQSSIPSVSLCEDNDLPGVPLLQQNSYEQQGDLLGQLVIVGYEMHTRDWVITSGDTVLNEGTYVWYTPVYDMTWYYQSLMDSQLDNSADMIAA